MLGANTPTKLPHCTCAGAHATRAGAHATRAGAHATRAGAHAIARRPAAGTAAELPWNFAPLASTDLASCAKGWDADACALLPHALAGLALRRL